MVVCIGIANMEYDIKQKNTHKWVFFIRFVILNGFRNRIFFPSNSVKAHFYPEDLIF